MRLYKKRIYVRGGGLEIRALFNRYSSHTYMYRRFGFTVRASQKEKKDISVSQNFLVWDACLTKVFTRE